MFRQGSNASVKTGPERHATFPSASRRRRTVATPSSPNASAAVATTAIAAAVSAAQTHACSHPPRGDG